MSRRDGRGRSFETLITVVPHAKTQQSSPFFSNTTFQNNIALLTKKNLIS